MLFGAPQALDEIYTLSDDAGQVVPKILRFLIGRNRRVEILLRGVADTQVNVGGRLGRIDREHLPKASNRLVVVLLLPGDVAELAQALDVVRAAFQPPERLAFVNRANAARELNPVVL